MFVLLVFVIRVVNTVPLSHERREYFKEMVGYVSSRNRAIDITTTTPKQQ